MNRTPATPIDYWAGKQFAVRPIHVRHVPLFEVYRTTTGESHVVCASFDRARKVADFHNTDWEVE